MSCGLMLILPSGSLVPACLTVLPLEKHPQWFMYTYSIGGDESIMHIKGCTCIDLFSFSLNWALMEPKREQTMSN